MTVQQESTGCRGQLTSLSELENLIVTVWPGVEVIGGFFTLTPNPFCVPEKSLGQKLRSEEEPPGQRMSLLDNVLFGSQACLSLSGPGGCRVEKIQFCLIKK